MVLATLTVPAEVLMDSFSEENFQNSPFLGNLDSPHLSIHVVNNAASLTGSVCNLSRVPAPVVSSPWLLPSASGTSFQTLMGNAYLYQHAGAAMLSGDAIQNEISNSASSNPGTFEWAVTGGSKKKSSSLRDFTVTVTDQDTTVSSMSMAFQYDSTLDANNVTSLYTSLSTLLVQVAPSQIPIQGQRWSLSYHGVSQGYYYNRGPLWALSSGELGSYLQSYGSFVSYMEGRVSVPQPELVMALKEIQPTNVIPPISTLGIYSSVSAQPITDQVFQSSLGMETSLGLQPPSQTFCLPQSPEFPKSCSSRNTQTLESNPPPALGDISVVVPIQSSSSVLALPPSPSQEKEENKNLDNIKGNLSKPDALSDQARKNKHKSISGASKAKIKPKSPDCMCLGEGGIYNAEAIDRAPVSTARHSNSKSQKAASIRNRKTKSHGQEKNRRNKDNSQKVGDNKQSGKKFKIEEKSTILKMKRKKNHPELTQETFKEPRTHLGMQMLGFVQVFHSLGKRLNKKTELFSGKLKPSQRPQLPPPTKQWLNTLDEGRDPEKIQLKCQKPDGSAEKEYLSPSQYELPPRGKVKLVSLPFLNLDKPTRQVPLRPQSLASHWPALTNPGWPGSNSVQPPVINSCRPTAASLTCPPRPAWSLSTKPSRPGLTNTTCPTVSQAAAPRPVTYKTSACTSFQWEPILTAVTKPLTPPKTQNQYLLQDFALQPIPWNKPTLPEPVMSKPITNEQRPEWETMKRMAQLEHENAAEYTSLGKVQYFIEREKEI
ncbi:LOW QUALITY PROTEIN: uncharacterized protein C2orf78-like [Glossophaga mutica]